MKYQASPFSIFLNYFIFDQEPKKSNPKAQTQPTIPQPKIFSEYRNQQIYLMTFPSRSSSYK
jgi:hypothetical protein